MMRNLLQMTLTALRRFKRDERGLAAAEMLMVMPIYMFCIFGTFTFWDAFDVVNRSQKAAYSVSDLVTRKQDNVTEAYVNGMFSTLQYMMGPSLPTRTRITSVFYSEARDRYEVLWSRASTPTIPRLTTATLPELQDHLPVMHDGDALIVVEANIDFVPLLRPVDWVMGNVDDGVLRHVIVTRPRFLPKICMQGVACG
ncbi:TadE/TadG family type IV pilus assembly protein [Pseudotabrizicola alkalilacus]|uniref:Pilus assembly protein n=1 Tax=Pseudotabrizicola alkalilacus TaxID=2305252 RepID=A0A411Z0J1_9RHOB|nr:TadE/TadG family type IV pilus assembly protein [Pseudotabrizicola alkalilacus]RGP36589.1 pilus assembly protein [Pseudotabrizicola alkalilacus]